MASTDLASLQVGCLSPESVDLEGALIAIPVIAPFLSPPFFPPTHGPWQITRASPIVSSYCCIFHQTTHHTGCLILRFNQKGLLSMPILQYPLMWTWLWTLASSFTWWSPVPLTLLGGGEWGWGNTTQLPFFHSYSLSVGCDLFLERIMLASPSCMMLVYL